ncbi:unnamed protein product [Alternaria alternata]
MVFGDEEQPLLRIISHEYESIQQERDGEEAGNDALDFELLDPENPRNWSKTFKWGNVFLLAPMAFTVTFICIGVVPVASTIVEDLDGKHSSSANSALLVTIWELGEAAVTPLIAPMSEIFGRYPVFNACNIGFIAATILAVLSQNSGVFIVARMLTGLCVASNVLNPAIIGDIFESEERGSARSLVMLATLIGGWRRMLTIAAALAIVCEVLFLVYFRETYKMTILRRRAAKTMQETGEISESKTTHEHLAKLVHSMTRPFAVLFGSTVLMLLSLFASVAFSFFYVVSVSLPIILIEKYDFRLAMIGTTFISFSVGSFCSVLACNFTLDRIYVKLRGPDGAKGKPEYRLPLSTIGAILLPFSVTAYGWIAEHRLPVLLLLASVALMGFSLLLTVIPLSAYVVDACGMYSASAMTGVIVTRCLMCTFLPLTTGPLSDALGYGLGFSILGALSLSLAIIPMSIFKFGEKWRQHSEFTKDS